ncbi:MAG: sulfite exporter TauE/SafE family protein [Pseudomonadota bacterium]
MDAFLTPDGMTLVSAFAVLATAMVAAGLTAALGLGGGLILLAIMTALMPIAAVIPVHGVAQLGSNAGRSILQWRNVVWPIVAWFAIGGVIGTAFGSQVLVAIPAALLKAGVGLFVLWSVWGPALNVPKPGRGAFFATGVVGSFLTLFFGATGPIAASVIGRAGLDRFATTGTHGACMLVQHLLKVVAFGALGFAYGPWAGFIMAIVLSGFMGTWIGTRILISLPEHRFRAGFKIALTAIAFWLLVSAGMAGLTAS